MESSSVVDHHYPFPRKNFWRVTWKMTFLIFFIPISTGGNEVEERSKYSKYPQGGLSGLYPGPYFDVERNHENVSVYVGTHAYLPCYVKQLGNKSVSWIRKSDAHILTVDRFTFIADERFQVLPLGESWTLQIKYVQPRDAGVYECQISTEPKLAFRVELRVMIPSIRMASKEENMFVWEGSQVQLRCILQNTVMDNLGKVVWYKNGDQIDKSDTSSARGVAFQSKMEDSSIIEIISLGAVEKADAGNYTCSLPSIGSATVTLHVLNGENPAAMHHGKGITVSSSASDLSMKALVMFLWSGVVELFFPIGLWR